MLYSQLPVIPGRVGVKFTLPMKMDLHYGMLFSRQAGNLELSQPDLVPRDTSAAGDGILPVW
jgi:hypothetical protein